MLGADPDDHISVIILDGGDIDRGAVIGVDSRPPRPWSPAEQRLCLVAFSWMREKGRSVP
jgi:hypothetical protein